MTPAKRLVDIVLAGILCLVLAPLFAGVALMVLIRDGRPVLYISERMKAPDTAFRLWKFRTMTTASRDSGVSGGDKAARITPLGARLRRLRLDELPQLINILRGDLSFVGPRPPLRRYVELRPDLYARVLRCRPGVTGLATLVYHAHEERLLARCRSAAETERAYLRRCVPAKARLDLIYARHRSLCFDLVLIYETVRRIFGQRRHDRWARARRNIP